MTRFTVPDDPVALRMENDLLAFEVDHLRGQIAALKERHGDAASAAELQRVRAELERTRRHLEVERERVEELAQARSDLRWLLGRLGESPAGPLLRRFEGFRTLAERWLDR